MQLENLWKCNRIHLQVVEHLVPACQIGRVWFTGFWYFSWTSSVCVYLFFLRELREKIQPEIMELIKQQRLNRLCDGTCFRKISSRRRQGETHIHTLAHHSSFSFVHKKHFISSLSLYVCLFFIPPFQHTWPYSLCVMKIRLHFITADTVADSLTISLIQVFLAISDFETETYTEAICCHFHSIAYRSIAEVFLSQDAQTLTLLLPLHTQICKEIQRCIHTYWQKQFKHTFMHTQDNM